VLTGYANAILAAQVAFPGTELNNVMAVASFWNVELLIFEFIGIALAIVYFGGAFLYFVSAFLPILPLLGTIAGSTSSVLVTLGLLRSVESIEDLHTETTSRSARLAMETRTALENLKRKTEALSARFGEAAKRK
jgi:membrane protein implicated in regulation of membrane protease activity